MSKQIKTISDLTPDPENANKGTERGLRVVEDSIRAYGAGRSIVTDKNGVCIAGNKTLESAADMGLEIEVIKTDGTKLVVVQREDLELGSDPRARQLAYADNRSSEVGLKWNPAQIALDLDSGIDLCGLFSNAEIDAMLCGIGETEPKTEKNDATLCPKCGHLF